MGVQDLIFGVVNMLHMLLSSALTLQNMLPLLRWRRMSMLHKKTRKCTKKGHLGLQLDMRYNVALLQSVAAALPKALWHWNFEKRKNWMAGCFPEMIEMIENHKLHEISHVFFIEEQNRFTAQPKRNFLRLSHTHANRNEYPYCRHALTSPTNTNILSLSLKNHNFKFVAFTRAASQPVALFPNAKQKNCKRVLWFWLDRRPQSQWSWSRRSVRSWSVGWWLLVR